MSNPTSNFGWQMPTPVDLVADLPADFEVFGQAVDSSLADLKGGTTGQILSKATNTDMDFVWITNDQGDITGITATSPLTGGGTSGAVTVGIQSASTSQSGAVQLSDSTSTTSSVLAATPTAVKSAYDLANRPNPSNPTLNSAMNVWQRGTSIAVNGAGVAYTADRWQIQINTAGVNTTISRQGTADTTNLPFIQYCARVQRNSGVTANGFVSIQQYFETVNSIPFAGKAVTVSFYARAGANYSASGSTLGFQLQTGTGTDQNNSTTGYTGLATPINSSATLTTTWQRFTFSGTIASTATEMGLNIYYATTGTAGANDYFELTGVQIDVGSSALPFRTAGTTYQQELAACQRYYIRYAVNGNPTSFARGLAISTTSIDFNIPLPVTLRSTLQIIDGSNLRVSVYGTNDYSSGTFTTAYAGPYGSPVVTYTHGSAVFTQNQAGTLNTTTGYLGLSAEL
jgi:hypothetical protein